MRTNLAPAKLMLLLVILLNHCVFLDAFHGAPPGNLSDHEVRSDFQKTVQSSWLAGCYSVNRGKLQGGFKCDKLANVELYALTAGSVGVSFLELPDPYYTEFSATDCKTEAGRQSYFFVTKQIESKLFRFESGGSQFEGVLIDELHRSAILAGKLAAEACMSKLKPGGRIVQAYGVGF